MYFVSVKSWFAQNPLYTFRRPYGGGRLTFYKMFCTQIIFFSVERPKVDERVIVGDMDRFVYRVLLYRMGVQVRVRGLWLLSNRAQFLISSVVFMVSLNYY